MKITKESIVGDIVAHDYHAASVFKAHNIDFCCRGGRSIDEVCEAKNISADDLVTELTNATATPSSLLPDFQSWDMDLLADYIQKKHHRYVEKKAPELKAYLHKIAKVHGDKHPELQEIALLFDETAEELASHMKKEENILFPYVRQMNEAIESNNTMQPLPFGTIKNPISVMHHEHDNEGVRFRKIAALSNNYTPPADACTTYKVAFSMLQEFEEDLHLHIHLENNILFPKAIESEQSVLHA